MTDALSSVARSLPALIRAEKVQKKASKAGFDWKDVSGAADKVTEELREVNDAFAGSGDVEEEIGDLLFAAVNVARFAKVDPERALEKATDKFVARFARVEQTAFDQDKVLSDLSEDELDTLWNKSKEKV
ncbi:MazG nucleotide pyrophosphohydrolase domain-containing protein [Agathobaculum sp. NTUH-O15-33]|uniref:MazG nucleotide pyrophosphohydrolase domain-containing protein n=1 Tax=Agathobaculum sp. NTUH-O15-33 TaxID=3079302 RepID=UPI00295873F7|nr:MazG nucleotide pyrophosphohydrolase domain-containing protein [Agathobaculum sp. NTUH-O15-33]WNX83159.1 MazG nucleotide pyrophosphohydrolase domain-containing protein [Agathobaculum sp. NTUH-O15-33]